MLKGDVKFPWSLKSGICPGELLANMGKGRSLPRALHSNFKVGLRRAGSQNEDDNNSCPRISGRIRPIVAVEGHDKRGRQDPKRSN